MVRPSHHNLATLLPMRLLPRTRNQRSKTRQLLLQMQPLQKLRLKMAQKLPLTTLRQMSMVPLRARRPRPRKENPSPFLAARN